MKGGAAFQGQPLLVFTAVLAAWVALRVLTWEAPFAEHYTAEPAPALLARELALPQEEIGQIISEAAPEALVAQAVSDEVAASPSTRNADSRGSRLAARPGAAPRTFLPESRYMPPPAPGPVVSAAPAPLHLSAPRRAAAHNALMLAGLSSLPLPLAIADYLATPPQPENVPLASFGELPLIGSAPGEPSRRRWSIDSSLLLRQGDDFTTLATRGSYGRSQMGAVLRYAFLPDSGHAPRGYIRATRALGSLAETEAALGVAARPIPKIPVTLAGEIRYYRHPTGSEWRPAGFAVTELPPAELPLGFRGEAYLQGGYVGGDFATTFIDGQLRVDRRIARLGDLDLRGGGGAWGGAQEGARGLDLGPGMSLHFNRGAFNARLSADYRFRVAGEAAPDSGARGDLLRRVLTPPKPDSGVSPLQSARWLE